ncbi:MAG: prolipoprotein diacylglyceryl transferase family protein [Candidatus Promineifilaceae bacterium]
MFPTLSLGPAVIPTAPLILLIGIWLLLDASERSARRLNLDNKLIYNLAVTTLVTGFVGARLVFVALHWSAYQNNLWGIVWPLVSGYEGWGGLLIGGFAALLIARRTQLPLWPTLDALTPALLIAFITISLADFLGGPGYGKPTTMPWGINLFNLRRHPVQVYELLGGVGSLWLWWRLTDPVKQWGVAFLTSAAAYAALRLFTDAYRSNTPLTEGGYHLIQLFCFVIMLSCLFLLSHLSASPPPEPTPLKPQISEKHGA